MSVPFKLVNCRAVQILGTRHCLIDSVATTAVQAIQSSHLLQRHAVEQGVQAASMLQHYYISNAISRYMPYLSS